MIQKPSQPRRALTWVIGMLMLTSCATSFAGTFKIKITPKNSGQVLWTTTNPSAGGTITGSGGSFTYTMNSSIVVLTFVPNPGGSIVKVMTNEGDDTSWVLGHSNQDSWWGPSENSKSVVVAFSGGAAAADPTGAFGFVFPTNNPSLTAIADISGTHTGTTATVSAAHPRLYSVAIAQDETGKLSVMGTVTGITNAAGNNQLEGSVGAITTVNNEPTAQLKGKFEGTVDGAPATASGSGQGPVAVSNIGGGTNGVTGTGSGSAKVAGVPYSARNTPLKLPAPNALSHIHKRWSIALTITNTASVGAKSAIMASANLTLPNGDHIVFPAKKTKYSAKGYKLSFKGGTNVTIIPNAVDKKTAISITGMTLTKPGSTWVPTAGTISYQFLGQKGTADLMDFVP